MLTQTSIAERLLRLGYEMDDINALAGHKDVSVARPLTDRGECTLVPILENVSHETLGFMYEVWSRILPILRTALADAHTERLEYECIERRRQRLLLVQSVYKEELRTSSYGPMAAAFFPPEIDIWHVSVAMEAIRADEPVSAQVRSRVAGAVGLVISLFPLWLDKTIDRMLGLLPAAYRKLTIPLEQHTLLLDSISRKLRIRNPLDCLTLACATFYCDFASCKKRRVHNTARGLEALLHRCWFKMPEDRDALSRIVFDEEAHDIVVKLLQLLNLPLSTTVLDLDRLDARFTCTPCASKGLRPHAETWRACVSLSTPCLI